MNYLHKKFQNEMENDDSENVELFSVGSEIVESSK